MPLRALLDDVMPRLGLDPTGYRNVRRTVLRRVGRRIAELGLDGPEAYRSWLEAHPPEWARLDAMCRIPISRLYRDAPVFERVARELLPTRALGARAQARSVRVWSAGCASGEEPCSVAIAWAAHRPCDVDLAVVATDADADALARARMGVEYTESSLSELPADLRDVGLEPGTRRVRAAIRASIRFVVQDLRSEAPEGPFDLVLCRNVAFTYFDEEHRRRVAEHVVARLARGGFLVLGRGEHLPAGDFEVVAREPSIYERR